MDIRLLKKPWRREQQLQRVVLIGMIREELIKSKERKDLADGICTLSLRDIKEIEVSTNINIVRVKGI